MPEDQVWEQVAPLSDLSLGEWVAQPGAWRVHVQATRGAAEPEHASVMRRLMAVLVDE